MENITASWITDNGSYHDNGTEGAPPGPPMGLDTFAIVMVTCQIVVMIVIVVGNILVLAAVCMFSSLRDTTGKFVANLAAADLLLGLTMPFQVVFFFFPALNMNKFACLLRYEIIGFTSLCSLLSLLCTVFDRYVAIVHPYTYVSMVTDKLAIGLIVGVWIYSLLYSLLPLFGWNNWNLAPICFYEICMNKNFRLILSLHFIILSFVMFVMYLVIFLIVRKHMRQIHADGQTNVNSQASSSNQMLKVMALVVLFFQASWLPFCFMQIVMYDSISPTKMLVSNFLVFLGVLNSTVNPVIYAWKNKKYRRAFRKLLCFSFLDEDFEATLNTVQS